MPGSVAFAGEFLILAGVFEQRLGLGGRRRGRDRARGDVHAAADLGRAAPERAARRSATRRSTCGRPSSRSSCRSSRSCSCLVWPWPAARSRRALRSPAAGRLASAGPYRADTSGARCRAIRRPPQRRLARALARSLATARRASGLALPLVAVLRAARCVRGRGAFAAFVALAGFVTAGIFAGVVFDRAPTRESLIAESIDARPLGRVRADRASAAPARSRCSSPGASGGATTRGEYYALLAAAGAGMAFFVTRREPDDALPRARVVLDLRSTSSARSTPTARPRSRPGSST